MSDESDWMEDPDSYPEEYMDNEEDFMDDSYFPEDDEADLAEETWAITKADFLFLKKFFKEEDLLNELRKHVKTE